MRDSVLVEAGRFIITEAAQPVHITAIMVNGEAYSRKFLFQLQKMAFVQLVILQWNDDQRACVIRTSLLCLDLWVVSKISLNSHRFLFMGGDCEYNQNVKIYGKPNYKGGGLGAAEKV